MALVEFNHIETKKHGALAITKYSPPTHNSFCGWSCPFGNSCSAYFNRPRNLQRGSIRDVFQMISVHGYLHTDWMLNWAFQRLPPNSNIIILSSPEIQSSGSTLTEWTITDPATTFVLYIHISKQKQKRKRSTAFLSSWQQGTQLG